MDAFTAKKAAYIQRYHQEPFVYRANKTSGPEIGCPQISDQPPLPNLDELVKKLPRRSVGSSRSGYEAGQAWASENGIADPSECANPSSSFEEGCRNAVEETDAATPDQATP